MTERAEPFEERAANELRRGVLQVAALALLRRRTYGYELLRILEERGMPTEEGTLYPVLRRLESEGLLRASWDTTGNRPRKYYESTDEGRAALGSLLAAWDRVNRSLRSACDLPDTPDAAPHDPPPADAPPGSSAGV